MTCQMKSVGILLTFSIYQNQTGLFIMLDLNGVMTAIISFESFMFGIFAFAHQAGHHKSHNLLGVLFLLFGLTSLDMITQWMSMHQFSLIGNMFLPLIPVSIYFYVRFICEPDFKWRKIHGLNLLPFILFSTMVISAYHLKPDLFKQAFLRGEVESVLGSPLLSIALHLHVIIYLFAAWLLLSNHNAQIKARFSNIEPLDMSWLKFLLMGYMGIWLFSAIFNSLRFIDLKDIAILVSYIQTTFVLFFINTIIYKVFVRHDLIQYLSKSVEELLPVQISDHRLSFDLLQFDSQLRKHITTEQPFLSADLTIDDLANSLNASTREFSIYLNDIVGQNFHGFINRLRIEHAQKLLIEQPGKTVFDILLDCGFNSKSSFNTSFKKYTEMTPSQYRSQNEQA